MITNLHKQNTPTPVSKRIYYQKNTTKWFMMSPSKMDTINLEDTEIAGTHKLTQFGDFK
jgi:hypothetical protein